MDNDEQVSEYRAHQGVASRNLELGAVTKDTISCWLALKKRQGLGLEKIVYGHSRSSYWILHVTYYGALTVAGTISQWWCRSKETIGVVDCIFNAVSALTNTGLASVLLRDFGPHGMFVIMVLMFLGHTVFVSLLPLFARTFQIFRHDKALTGSATAAETSADPRLMTSHAADANYATTAKKKLSSTNGENISRPDQSLEILQPRDGHGHVHGDLDGSEIKPETLRFEGANPCGKSCQNWKIQQADHQYVAGLLERQALVTLSWLVPLYMTTFLCFGFVAVLCYTSFSSKGSSKVSAVYETEGVNPISTAIFLSISAFSNSGLSPLDENMVPFASSPLVLVPLAALILAGNSMFPPTLRLIIWGLSRMKRTDDPDRNVYKYLLQFPRQCYTHLFPQVHTTWLVATVVAFNVVDLVAFCAFEWNAASVTADLSDPSAGIRLVDGLFQSLNTRSAGMNILQLSSLSAPLLILYTAIIGIASYPVFLSRHHSRLTLPYVTQLHQHSDLSVAKESAPDERLSVQFRKLFTRDSASIFIHIFTICTVELRSINSDPLNYSIFSIAFEVISAYANVGLSLGYRCEQWVRASANTPHAQAAEACRDVPYSFSGKWTTGSKLVLVGVMLAGRHRSLYGNMDCTIARALRSSPRPFSPKPFSCQKRLPLPSHSHPTSQCRYSKLKPLPCLHPHIHQSKSL